jgi:outer membrane protein
MRKAMYGFLLVAALCVATVAQAQKIGYTNSQGLLAGLPEVKQAESQIEAFQTQYQKRGEEKVKAFQAKYADLAQKEKTGVLSPKQLEEESKKLEEDKAGIQKLEQEMQTEMQKKREALYQPILAKVNKAIDEVSKEKGFQFIFDAGTGIVLFADPANDATPFIKAKLGTATAATPVGTGK